MFAAIEINNNDVIVHAEFDSIEAAEAAVRNVKRRVGVVGEVFAASMFDVEEIVENNSAPRYVTFAQAAEMLNVRYQQVFQRAVVKGKMRWMQTPVNHVMFDDVMEWKAKRES
jgi:hypothetical protein